MTCNTAVFYDVENLISLFNVKSNRTLQLDEIYRRILNLEIVQGISVQKAYADWAQPVNRNLRGYVLQIGIEPVQIFNTNQNDKVKNAADVSLIIDAVELLAKHPEVENYVIASGDGIFAFLAKKLHEYGKRVIGCGFDRNTNIIFRNSCDIFLALERNDKTLAAVVKTVTKGTIHAQDPAPGGSKDKESREPETAQVLLPPDHLPEPSPIVPAQPSKPHSPAQSLTQYTPHTPLTALAEIKIPSKLPKNKFSEVLVGSDISIWKNSRDQSGSLHVIKRMVNVLFEWAGIETDLEISLFKAYLDHYLPNFRIGHYGFKRFGEFMRFLVTASPYCLVVSEGTVLRIARRDAPQGDKDVEMEDMANLLFTLSDSSVTKSLFDIEDGKSFTFDIEGHKEKEVQKETQIETQIETQKDTQEEAKVEVQKEIQEELQKELQEETQEKIKEEIKEETQEEEIQEEKTLEEINLEEIKEEVKCEIQEAERQEAERQEAPKDVVMPFAAEVIPDARPQTGTISEEESKAESARMWIKNTFMRLSREDKLTAGEVKRLQQAEYSLKTFGVKVAVCKQLRTQTHLRDQRLVDGKIKYWKEEFKFKGKGFLIFKEWTDRQHRSKFEDWLKKIEG